MGCTQSTPSRTRRRRQPKYKPRRQQPGQLQSKEMATKNSSSPPDGAIFYPETNQFLAPDKMYKPEHIDQTVSWLGFILSSVVTMLQA